MPSCASPNATYVDGPDPYDDALDIDYIIVNQEWINVTYLDVPAPPIFIYGLELSDDGTNSDVYFDSDDAVLEGFTLTWNISATVSGWDAVYFRTHVLPGQDMYPDDLSFAGPDPDAVPELPVTLVLPLLVSLLAMFSLYRRK